MNLSQKRETKDEELIRRAKNRYLQKRGMNEKHEDRSRQLPLFFAVCGSTEGLVLLHFLPEHQFGNHDFLAIFIPGVIQFLIAVVIIHLLAQRNEREASKPENLLPALQEVLQEDRNCESPLYEGTYNILLKFRNSEWVHGLERSHIDAADQLLQGLKQLCQRQSEALDSVYTDRLRSLEVQITQSAA
jgi:hypothetical protein